MMSDLIKKIKKLFVEKRSILIYLIVGAFTNILDIVLFAVLVQIDVHYLIASTISTAVALLSNFLLHRTFTFGSKGRIYGQAGRFVLSISFNYLVSQVILFLSVSVFGIDEVISKFISLVIVVLYNYFLLQKWVFKK